jgi:hypothetical protein
MLDYFKPLEDRKIHTHSLKESVFCLRESSEELPMSISVLIWVWKKLENIARKMRLY